MKLLLLSILLCSTSVFAQVDYTVTVLRLKAKADPCDGGLAPLCPNQPQDPVYNIWTIDAEANTNTYCWIFEDDPNAAYNVWTDIQNLEIANEVNVMTSYIEFEMSGFESDAITSPGCTSGIGDEAVMNQQFVLQVDLATIPPSTPTLYTLDLQNTYFAEVEIEWIDLTASAEELDNYHYNVVPNPSEGIVYVKAPSNSTRQFDIQVLDMMGRLVHAEEHVMANQTIDLSMVDAGTYFIQFTSGNKRGIEQIILK